MLFSIYPQITLNYLLLSFLVCVGVLQWQAARSRTSAFSLLGACAFGWPGQIVGLGLITGAFIWFFWGTPGLFEPGLAGGELSTLFGVSALAALAVSRLGGAFWRWH